jgi:hypothetical protein
MKKILILAVSILSVVALVLMPGAPDWSTSPAHGQPPADAEAKVIAAPADLVEGPLSRGRIGDFLLANGEIQVVIQDVQRNLLNVGQFGGQIIDADLVRAPEDPERDNFEEWAFGINIENTAHYTDVTVINDGSGGVPAVIRATGVDDLLDWINPSSMVESVGAIPACCDDVDLPVEITTDYTLAPGDNYVTVETTVRNTDPTDPVETFLSDWLGGSGQVELFQSGYGFGEPMVTTACALCNFVAWSGEDEADGVSYGYIHDIANTTTFADSGVIIPILGTSAILALLGVAPPNYTIDPLDEITVTRYFAVGDGSVGAIVDIRNQILALTTGTLQGTVTRGGAPVEGVDVAVLGDPLDGPGTQKNVVSHYRTAEDGTYSGTLPPDDYTVRVNLDGHLAGTPDPASVTVTAAGTTTQDFTIPEAGRVRVTIVDESSASIAGKVSFVGFDPFPDPGNYQQVAGLVDNNTGVFGDIFKDGLTFGLAKVVFVDQTGDSGEVFIEPGDYQVVVSHGAEYSVFKQDITVTAGALTTVNAQIARVIDTSGFISADFHSHTIESPDSEVTHEERIISMIAEGVDYFPTADHEFRLDMAPVVASLGVGDLISVVVGNENTSPDYGHWNAWPLTIDPTKVNNGALDWAKEAPAGQDFPSFGNYMMPPAEIHSSLLADPGVETLQLNHVYTFFGPEGLAIDTGLVPPQHTQDELARRLDPAIANLFDDGFTALEILNGTTRDDIFENFIGRDLGDWFNLMNQDIVRTGTANSDTHKTVKTQAGGPRNMVASPTDDPGALGAIAETLSENVNAGRTIGTNTPFVEVTTEATSTGDTGGLALGLPTLISTTDGAATITVEIQSPLWAEFDKVEYYINNVPTPDDYDADPLTPPFYRVTPDVVQTAGVDFTINTIDDFPLIPGAEHLEATTSINLTALTEDTWVVVLVRGTDSVSEPLFPVVPNDLDETTNPTLADLKDGNLGELGIPATAFANPVFVDVNGNAEYDAPLVDSDDDGFINSEDNCPLVANPGQEDVLDGDGVGDACDNCPTVSNPVQENNDADSHGDACDNCPDDDNEAQTNSDTDSHGDACDNCPDDDNEPQANSDTDSHGDVCDNCPDDDNEDQVDAPDGDGMGNVCDTDDDEDGELDVTDNCPLVANPGQEDILDGDGVGDACDNCPTVSNPGQENDDGDEWGNACDNCPTTSTSWYVPVGDDDCDGFTTAVEGHVGTDPADACTDNPGVHDAWPLDINVDTFVTTVGDVLPYAGNMGKDLATYPELQRLDLNMDSWITVVGDALAFSGMMGVQCTNP